MADSTLAELGDWLEAAWMDLHERFDRAELPLPSDRSTGFVFAAVAAVIALFWRAEQLVLYVSVGLAIGFAAVSLLAPYLLRPLNIAWMKFALLLSKVMNPIVMFLLFAITIVPAGLIMQLRSDPLRKQRQKYAGSYWLERKHDPNASMTNQF